MKIGFVWNKADSDTPNTETGDAPKAVTPRKSVVQIYFSGRGMEFTYYNDRFDLKVGDYVFVDGKLEGQRGRVTEVNYNFKIRPSKYQKVIAVADTEVKGQFYPTEDYFVSFDRNSIPAKKIAAWFIPPYEDEDFISGADDTAFRLDDLSGMMTSPIIEERGHKYYREKRVEYLSVDGTHGYAIVAGTEDYEVEFEYQNGEISHLVCSCYCCYHCKHEIAVMLQLKKLLSNLEKDYRDLYEENGYFAAILKDTLFRYSMGNSRHGFSL